MHIAIFCPNWIGDAVMATPAIAAIRHRHPKARLIAVLKPYVEAVYHGCPWFDEVVQYHGPDPSHRLLSVAWRLRGIGIDIAVLFPNSFRSAFLAWLGGAKRIVGYARGGRSFLLSDPLPPVRDEIGRFVPSPILDAYNRLAEVLHCDPPGRRMFLYTLPEDEQVAEDVWRRHRLLDAYPVVLLNPGAAYGSAKHWPVEYFGQLAQMLVDRRGASVLVLCGPSEREMAGRIAELANRSVVTSLADEPVTIGLLKACIRRGDLLITTDSGPRHFAAAFDRPVVTLFGPTHIAWTETYFDKAVHLQKTVPCGPCQLRVCPLDHRCMKLLTPDEVFEAAMALLARHLRQHSDRGWGWLPFRWNRRTG
ncbi:MAG: lipopolysaccharide heptosyltransferase II [Gemmatales bacterium]|nr:lipopolysaccharide heptosyltransferase II [Gemmatales bacterium]MDW8387912.1 lipopolysaccharide heptosyltransferase II [Gemmatales bacterium]